MGKNRGEWSEFYVVVTLLLEPKLEIVNSKLDFICNDLFIIEKLTINEKENLIDYLIDSKKDVKVYFNSDFKETISKQELLETKKILITNILNFKKGKGSFEIDELNQILQKMTGQNFMKSNSNSKSDLTTTVLDKKLNDNLVLKYSIKSSLGSPATILNASNATNFTYEVKGISKKQMQEINKITTSKLNNKLRDGLKQIYELGGEISYSNVDSKTFKYNLQMIDSKMPEYLANVLLNFYKNSNNSLKDLFLSNNLFEDKDFALKKLSDFLEGISFGLFPKEKWDGVKDVNGGLIIVKRDGKIVILDLIYYEKEVLNYLIEETKLDTPSSTRYKMLQLYEENGKIYFNLNLQIRYKK